ncbi:hypothetical protein EDC01DRAFT_790064 [Geopyxis carbonaria]|nr:hypothetical protein EDC01DRAFT_790064 [Geopyxis carbonaria]
MQATLVWVAGLCWGERQQQRPLDQDGSGATAAVAVWVTAAENNWGEGKQTKKGAMYPGMEVGYEGGIRKGGMEAVILALLLEYGAGGARGSRQ